MPKIRPYVLSLAGFDPSGGAGLLADIKTFEAHKTLGLGVCTALTVQNDELFERVDWVGESQIMEQIDILFRRFKPKVVKIGLMSGKEMFQVIIHRLLKYNPGIRIIWDPVLNASAGFSFHSQDDYISWKNLLEHVFLITPNWVEIQQLSQSGNAFEAAKAMTRNTNVFLKGGHNEEHPGKDYLFTQEGKVFPFNPKKIAPTPKHGSGCVLSSAIAANLAKGYKLHGACLRAKSYISRFLMSNDTLLGYHKI